MPRTVRLTDRGRIIDPGPLTNVFDGEPAN